MTAPIRIAVAPNFQLADTAADRVLLADGSSWRPLAEAEASALSPPNAKADGGSILLFVLPAHLRASFWAMMEQDRTAEDFDAFALEVSRFLAFKQLPPPDRAEFELVLHRAAGEVEPHRLWAIVNLGDEPVVLGAAGMRVRLGPGEGCRLSKEVAAEVMPPKGDAPNVLLLVRD